MSQRMCFVGMLALLSAGPVFSDVVPVGEDVLHRVEWRASTFSGSRQEQASIDVAPDGRLLVVWSSRRQQGGTYGVYGQWFTPDGVAIGGETRLNLWTESHQDAPAVGFGLLGDETHAVAAWQSHRQDGAAGSIVARAFDGDASGASEVLVNEMTSGHQDRPAVVGAPSGDIAVLWTSHDPISGVRARWFTATGTPLSDEFACDDGRLDRHAITPAGASADDGTLAIAFAARGLDGALDGVRMRLFDRCGSAVGAEIDVDEPGPAGIEPVVAAVGDGWMVAWLDAESDGDDYGVLARRFDRQGGPRGAAFVVNAVTEGPQNAAAIATAPDGRVAIAWNGRDGDGAGIFAQLFSPGGARLGEAFRVNRRAEGRQEMHAAIGTRRLAWTADGRLACAWSGDGGFGDDSGVHVTLLSPRPVEAVGARGVTEAMLAAADDDAGERTGAAPHVPPTFDPKRRAEGVRQFIHGSTGLGFTGVFDTGWDPPDPHIAVGPDHVVVMTNGEISFYTKDGTLTFTDQIEGGGGFWGSVGASGFIFDPECLWDPIDERFWAMAADDAGATSFVLIAVSDDADPNGTWHKWRFNTSSLAGGLFDSPNISVGENVVYITGDGFGLGANYPVFTYEKAPMLNGNNPGITRQTTMPTSTQSAGIPPIHFPDAPALYMCEHGESASNTQVRLIALTDPLGTPTFAFQNVNVPSYGSPEDPPQAGTSSRPITFDARFWSVDYRNGSLWATHHINSSRVIVRWYEFAMNGWPTSGQQPVLVQSGDIDPGGTVRTYFTSIAADDAGNAAICFSRSSPSEFITMQTAFRAAGDPPGSFQEPITRQASNGPSFSSRWGDYSGVVVAPDGAFWAHHEYAISSSWRTWVQSFTPVCNGNGPDVNCDGLVDINDLLTLLAEWGACPGCVSDLNGDDVVDIVDLLAMLAAWSPV